MRIYILMTFFSVFTVSVEKIYSQPNTLTFRLGNVTLKDVINRIERATDYLFLIMDDADKELNKSVSVDFQNKSIDEILDVLLEDTSLSYNIVKRQVTIRKKIPSATIKRESLLSEKIKQQPQKNISGRITDEQGEAIIGANVVEKGTTNGTITDIDGNFFLSIEENSVIVVSYIGYKTQEINIAGKSTFDIVLQENTSALAEVVVVGYGTQKKETLTGSISTVSSKDLVLSPNANIANSLVGRVQGIAATQSSGEAGNNASTIRIRGISTLNESGRNPLIVIDGVQSTIETMNALDPNEIETVSVLKDASSTAIYGVKGANGVIILTTKRGKAGTPKIELSYRYGFSQLTSKLQLLNSYDYAVFRNEAIKNDMLPGNYQYLFTDDELWKFKNNRDYTPTEVESMNLTAEQKQALLNSPALYYRDSNLYEELFGGLSPQYQFNINLSGGGDRFHYFVSLGHFNELGVFDKADYAGKNVNSKYKRYNLRSNIDINVHKNLKIELDFGGQFEDSDGMLGPNGATDSFSRLKEMLVNILAAPPYSGPGFLDGKLISGYSQSTNPLSGKGANGYSGITNLFQKEMLNRRSSNFNMITRIEHTLDYLVNGLTLSGTIAYSDTYTKGRVLNYSVPTYTVTRNPLNPSEVLFFGGAEEPNSIKDNVYNNKWNRLYLEAKLSYEKKIDKHLITALVLYNIQTTKYPDLQYNVASNLIGTAGRFTYDYDNRYLAEFNMGYNGSENFPEGKRFGFFPAFSGGWIVSNEKFFPQDAFISWLKLRGSYGVVGNDQIGNDRFLYLPNAWESREYNTFGGYFFGRTDGTYQSPYYVGYGEKTVGNPDVTWEKARKWNVGIDWYMFNNRLTLTADYFHEKRANILWHLGTIPGIVAADLAPANIGKVQNKGYEISLGWNDKIRDFTYSLGLNLAYAKNKIEFMDEPAYPYEWMNTTGFSIGQYKGFRTDGFYNNQEEANNRPYVDLDGNHVGVGDIRYIDINGDGVINTQDRTPIGYSNLPLYTMSSTMFLGYKGISLSLLFTGSYGGSIPMSSFYLLNPFYMVKGNALQFQYDGRWTPEKVEQGVMPTFPRASVRTYDSQNGAMNDLWLRSTQFFRLKNAELAYTFQNPGVLKRMGISNVRVFLNGNNLLTWGTKLIGGFDPEQSDTKEASEGYLYPPTRTYNFGVNVQF